MAKGRTPRGLIDAKKLAAWQIAEDRDKTIGGALGKRIGKQLFARKIGRMRASPFAFLRGAAPLFYGLLRERPDLERGPRGSGWIAGDLHLENFGAYHPEHLHHEDVPASPKTVASQSATRSATESATKSTKSTRSKKVHESRKEHRVAFGLNDFDDAVIAPWRYDVLRLMTSVILAGRELGCDGARAVYLCRALLDAYVTRLFDGEKAKMPDTPGPVLHLVAQVAERSRRELLDGRTEVSRDKHGHETRTFIRGERYADLPRELRDELPQALAKYAKSIPKEERPSPEELQVQDAAVRIAGTGSLGSLRIAALVHGKGGVDGGWVIDLKEQGAPSATKVLGKLSISPEQRVMQAFGASCVRPPRLLGTSSIAGVPLFVRRLMPQEDKLDLAHLDDADLEPLARYLGALVGASHARGAKKDTKKAARWKKSEMEGLIDSTIVLAGIHEAVYLAYCKMVADGL